MTTIKLITFLTYETVKFVWNRQSILEWFYQYILINTSVTVMHSWSVIGVRGEYDRRLVLEYVAGEQCACLLLYITLAVCDRESSWTLKHSRRRGGSSSGERSPTLPLRRSPSSRRWATLYLSIYLSCLASFVLPCTFTLSSYPSYTKTTPITRVKRKQTNTTFRISWDRFKSLYLRLPSTHYSPFLINFR